MNEDIGTKEQLQKKIGIKFNNTDILEIALTHKSYAIENDIKEYNERLEFIGDSVLSSATAVYLYSKYPGYNEGKLSKIKSAAVSKTTLYAVAKKLGLGNYIKISNSEEATGGREKESILANTVEAIIGAIFLDSGYDVAEKFIHNILTKQKINTSDYKSELQESIQSKYKMTPTYKVLEETGPDHEKIFLIAVTIGKKQLGCGSGKSKKEAEQDAAKNAIKKLR
ncbi:MAG: ribonuclease III [Elusimicrobia bacterium RIFOXYD2_FULL_34_15]|nr:MAG: ribonuclease III [Elusimicrobia bacterium RIFOXYD2_FULL_34_15]